MAIQTKVYTREQLISAMRKWNKKVAKNMKDFGVKDSLDMATNQVDELLSYAEPIK